MRLSEVPVVELTNTNVVVTKEGDGSVVKTTEESTRRVYDFGPDNRGHEEHVQFGVEEFTCAVHELFDPNCAECVAAVFEPPTGSVALHLKLSRGIDLEV